MQIGKYNIFRVVDQPTFNLNKVVEEYETLLEKHFYFAIDHPLIYISKFDDLDNSTNKHLVHLKNSAALYVSKFLTKTNFTSLPFPIVFPYAHQIQNRIHKKSP
jgi:hypothetical protein